jgi:hypothetical protein
MTFALFAKWITRSALFGIIVTSTALGMTIAEDKPCNYPPPSAIGPDGWIDLFNGKDLTGWKIGDKTQSKIHVEDGKIVAAGPRSHAFTDYQFKNFEFEADVMTIPGSNSGIYFHTKFQEYGFPRKGYESQVNVSHGDKVKTGSLYHVVKLYETPAKDNQWWKQTIIVQGKHITVKIDDKTVIDYTEPEKVERQEKLSCGSFALQAHNDGSVTYFRNLRVKPLPD